MTKVVNMRREDADQRIDRQTRFGNPFRLEKDGGEYSREESVEEYREWFYDRVENDTEFREAVHELKGKTLGCWCKPKRCHGDVIKEYLDKEGGSE